MVAEAERNRSEDRRVREEVDARNMLDSAAYQVEKAVSDDTPAHEKARAEMLVQQARDAVKNEAPLDQVRSLTGELQQVHAALTSARPSGESTSDSSGGATDDDVVDAEFDRA
jgi:molecular chaperone DnaK